MFLGFAAAILLVLLFCWRYLLSLRRIPSMLRLWRASTTCSSFYEWSIVVRNQYQIMDYTAGPVDTPKGPCFMLGNHIDGHCEIASFITIAGTVQAPTTIICYRKYQSMLFFASTIHGILQNEIVIDSRSSPADKEKQMVDGIRTAFGRGQNVIMLVDAHRPLCTMRSLNKKVLEYFPNYPKQVIRSLPTSDLNQFGYIRYPPTYDLDLVIEQRRDILAENERKRPNTN
jgi:hypothetical protein